ncbi:response regulator [Candidatus Pacearchaeota archaeon]|nr:response regulator [Candidatus Pacearchaeota archaeon]
MKKILIVDDEADVLETMRTILEKEEYGVTTAKNGAYAIDLLKTVKPDLILLDIMMPTLSGYDLLRLLREKLNHKVKMVYVTVVPKSEVDMADIDGFIQKPFSPKEFVKKIKEVLK